MKNFKYYLEMIQFKDPKESDYQNNYDIAKKLESSDIVMTTRLGDPSSTGVYRHTENGKVINIDVRLKSGKKVNIETKNDKIIIKDGDKEYIVSSLIELNNKLNQIKYL